MRLCLKEATVSKNQKKRRVCTASSENPKPVDGNERRKGKEEHQKIDCKKYGQGELHTGDVGGVKSAGYISEPGAS